MNKKEKYLKRSNGITLIALVVTIIVLIILAGVSINLILGDNGIIKKGNEAKEAMQIAKLKEEAELVKSDAYAEYASTYRTLSQTDLVRKLNEHFEGSTVSGNVITTADGRYDMIVDEELNITVKKHEEKQITKGDVKLSYKVFDLSSYYDIELTIQLLGIPEYNVEELKKDYLTNQFLMDKTTEELMVIAGKLATSGTEMTDKQVYDNILKSELGLDGITYEDFMKDKDEIIYEKTGIESADLYAKLIIVNMAETNIGIDVGTVIPYSKQIVPELVGKEETEIKNTVEGYYNNEYTFDQIVSRVYGVDGITLDMLEAQIYTVCYGTGLFTREEIMLVVASGAYADTHKIVITYPNGVTSNIDWYGNSDLTIYNTVEKEGQYKFTVTGVSGNTEEIVAKVGKSIKLDKTEITKVIIENQEQTKETLTASLFNLEEDIIWTSSDENVAQIEGTGTTVNVILKSEGVGEATITVTCGEYSATCTVALCLPVDGSYSQTKKVNTPKIDETQAMKLVSFDSKTKTWVEDKTKSDYAYIAGTGTEDNTSSKWANAVVTVGGVDSYFVWIPRYAYKIDSINKKIDVKFIKGIGTTAVDGTECKYADDKTLTANDYIVHPAFTANADLGGGFGELAGLWIGKYESSRSNATATSAGNSTTLKVVPSVKSWTNTKIGDMYTYAKAYNTKLNSHMLKNSEWGAVAYLTHSKYGRNGNEIAVNQCEDILTGAGPGTGNSNIYNGTYAYDASNFETTYSYISEQGKKASTTGNEYGIYDMSGGALEYVASYYNSSTYTDSSTGLSRYEAYASSFASSGGTSNEYATVYTGTTVSNNYIKGDATYETSSWNSDGAGFVNSDYPFFGRSSYYIVKDKAGSFHFAYDYGTEYFLDSFRTALVVK